MADPTPGTPLTPEEENAARRYNGIGVTEPYPDHPDDILIHRLFATLDAARRERVDPDPDQPCAECTILRRYHDHPEAGRDHPFRGSPVYECEADEYVALAQQLHDSIAEGQTVAETAKALRLLAPSGERVDPDLRARIERIPWDERNGPLRDLIPRREVLAILAATEAPETDR